LSEPVRMSSLRTLVVVVLFAGFLPLSAQAGAYRLRVADPCDTVNAKRLFFTDEERTYEFSAEADYLAARKAYEVYLTKVWAFARAIREECEKPTEARHQQFLVCRQEYRRAYELLVPTLGNAKR
jgi:hypothetical protein